VTEKDIEAIVEIVTVNHLEENQGPKKKMSATTVTKLDTGNYMI
jgi:hypothetical protein